MTAMGTVLSYPVAPFPITYLGLSLSVLKVHHTALMPLVNKIYKKLSTWRASLLSRSERIALVRHVLSVMPLHLLLYMALSPLILKLVTKAIRYLLWHGHKEARSGSCLVSWPRVCRSIKLGGLGIRGLHRTGISLRV